MADDMEAFLAGHLDGSLDETGRGHLLSAMDADPTLAERFAIQAVTHRWLQAHIAAPLSVDSILKELPSPRAPSRFGWRRVLFPLPVLMAAAGGWFLVRSPPHQFPRQMPAVPSPDVPSSMIDQTRTIDLRPIADVCVEEGRTLAVSGHLTVLRVQGPHPGPEQVALLRFAIPPGRILDGRLILRRIHGSAIIQLRQVDPGTWTEDDLRFWHLPDRGTVLGTTDKEDGVALESMRWTGGVMSFLIEAPNGGSAIFGSREDAGHTPLLRLRMICDPPPENGSF